MVYVIFGDSFTFPDGNAATNRVYTYAKGFNEHGKSVHIVCFRNDYTDLSDGETDGIKYYHPFHQNTRNSFLIKRIWLKFLKYVNAYTLLKGINNNEAITAIHVYSIDILTQLYAFVLAKALNTRLLVERSEHPLRSYSDNAFKKLYGNFKVFLDTKLYNAIFCISDYLINFYISKGFQQE